MSRLLARLHRLEHVRNTAEHQPRQYVLDMDAPLPPVLREGDTVIRLPHKAASVEEWLAQVRAAGFPRPQEGGAP